MSENNNTTYNKFEQIYDLFFENGSVVEIRALGLHGTNPAWEGWSGGAGIVFGYFDNAKDFSRAATSLAALSNGALYFTLNLCQPALLARACNRLISADKKRPTTSDKNIAQIRWLFIDIDPVRPSGISSSDAEVAAAKEIAIEISTYLEKNLEWPKAIRAMSGNGYHLIYRVPDLPNTAEISGRDGMIHRCLQALNARFSNDKVQVDTAVHNASRILKLYGTWARKGDSTKQRPHRQSFLFDNTPSDLSDVPLVSRAQLDALAAQTPEPVISTPSIPPLGQPSSFGQLSRIDNFLGEIQMDKYLDHYGIGYRVEVRGDTSWYLLDSCPFDSSHRGGEAAIVVAPGRPITFTCFHNSCQDRKWHEVRSLISGQAKILEFCSGYNPDGKSSPRSAPCGDQTVLGTLLQNIDVSDFLVGERALTLPNPKDVDPMTFITVQGKREKLNQRVLLNFVVATLDPIVFTAGEFWRWWNGVWRREDANEVGKVAGYALGERLQSSALDSVEKSISKLRNRRELDWQVDENLINLANGMLDISQVPFALLPHEPKQWSRSQLPVAYEPDANCPLWIKSVDEMMEGVIAKIMLLQEFFGYCLLPTCRFEKALFLFGTGGNGKSLALKVLEILMIGQENTAAFNLEALNRRFTVPFLRGKMINITTELETSRAGASTEVLKKAISGDLLEGEIKNGDSITFHTFTKFLFAMNTPPTITDRAYGFARKILVLNFNRRFSDGSQDPDLFEKLKPEAPGILNWALAGAARLLAQGGFTVMPENINETESFMASLNPVLQFFQESVAEVPGAAVPMSLLYEKYCTWCAEARVGALARPRFIDQVTQHFRTVDYRRNSKRADRSMAFHGLALIGSTMTEDS